MNGCICGHPDTVHADGVGGCGGAGNACECQAFAPICEMCRHAMTAHVEESCARVLMSGNRRGERCGCSGKKAVSRIDAIRRMS